MKDTAQIDAAYNPQHNGQQPRSILDNTVDGIVVMNKDGVIISFNHGCEELFGYTADEAIGQTIDLLVPPFQENHRNFLDDYVRMRHSISSGTGREIIGARKDKSEFPLSVSVGEVTEQDTHFYVAIMRDMTEQKQHESDLLKYTKALEDSNHHLDDFVYIVSHDLKEPIRGISSYAQFMIEDHADEMDDDARSKLHSMVKMSKRMDDLIDRLLYFSRLNRTELAHSDLDLHAVVADIIDLLEPMMLEQKVTIHIDNHLPTVTCDQARAGEVFRNLITNAIKYNDKEDKVVNVGVTTEHPQHKGQNVFYVRDNGIGIDDRYYDTIFKMFKRLHGRDAYGGGTGSGLAIVKKIISQHNGQIWVDSHVGEGTTFFFTLGEKKDA